MCKGLHRPHPYMTLPDMGISKSAALQGLLRRFLEHRAVWAGCIEALAQVCPTDSPVLHRGRLQSFCAPALTSLAAFVVVMHAQMHPGTLLSESVRCSLLSCKDALQHAMHARTRVLRRV